MLLGLTVFSSLLFEHMVDSRFLIPPLTQVYLDDFVKQPVEVNNQTWFLKSTVHLLKYTSCPKYPMSVTLTSAGTGDDKSTV